MDQENGYSAATGSLEPYRGSGLRPFAALAVYGMIWGIVVGSVLLTSPTAVTVLTYVAPVCAVVGAGAGAWYGFFFNISNHCSGGRVLWAMIGGLGAAALAALIVSLVMVIVGTASGFAAGWIVGSFLKGERRYEAPLIGASVGAIVQAGWGDPAAAARAGALGGVVGATAGPVFLLVCFALGYVIRRKNDPSRPRS